MNVVGKPSNIDELVLIEALQVGLYVIQQGKFSFVNSYLSRMLGYDNRSHLIGKAFWSIVHPDDAACVSFRAEDEKGSEDRRKHDFRLIKKNGDSIWVRMKGKNSCYQGRPANVGHVKNISAIKEIEKNLVKYRMIIDQVEDTVAEVDLNGNLLFINASGAKRYGTLIEDAHCDQIESYLGRNNINYRSYMDKKSAENVGAAYRKVLETGVPSKNIIYEIIRPDGSRIVVEDSVSLIRDHNETPIGYRTLSRDVSSRVEAEKKMAEHRLRLEAIFRSVNDAIITIDSDFKVIEANRSTINICGMDAGKLVGQKFPDSINCCSQACVDVLWKTLRQKRNTRELRIECRRKDRSRQNVTISSSPLLDSEGRFLGGVLVIRDITQLKNLENELISRHQFRNIIGKSQKMRDIFCLLEDLSNVETTVLINGKSGTGKELVAKALHYGGRRALKPFIAVNCSALAENLLESELFGHVKGAFTGAIYNKQGRFQAADGGTIMLDEMGDISPLIQLKLLRVIQEKEFERVGDIKPCKVDVRLIACTNKDLRQKVKSGQFREDLYYRLKVMEIDLPPLNERIEDIPLLVEYFCKLYRKEIGKKIMGLSDDAMEILMSYGWPGNVRELKHIIERAFVLCSGNIISPQHLPAEILKKKNNKRIRYLNHKQYSKNREAILYVLRSAEWNKSKAAQMLGISRQTLYRRIEDYEISMEHLPAKIIKTK